MLPPNSIIPFDGNHASIPAGFTRDTRFDDKFPKGDSSGWGTTGGSNTHAHTSPAHSHTMVNHTHTMKLYAYSGAGEDDGDGSGGTDTGHSHWGSDPKTSSTMIGGTLSDAITYPSSSSIPSYYSFIFIKASSYRLLPLDGVVFSQNPTREDCAFHSASANRNIVGASAGANAGITGGADNHTHDLSHTHTAVNHSHTGQTLTDYSSVPVNTSSGNKHATSNHSHTLYWADYSTTGSSATLTSKSASNIPLSQKLNLFKATKQTTIKPGDIILTTESTVPIGWLECNGLNNTPNMVGYYVRNHSSATSGATPVGSTTHLHPASISHTHGSTTHSHTTSTSYFSENGETGTGSRQASKGHSHGTYDGSSNVASWNSSQVSASNASNNEPPYIGVRFIQATASALGGGSSIMSRFL